jgi:hypothetical protein
VPPPPGETGAGDRSGRGEGDGAIGRGRSAYVDDGTGVDGYFAAGIGGLLLLLYPNVVKWCSHVLFGTAFPAITDTATGAPVPYPKSIFFPGDMAVTAFAVALVVEGVVLIAMRRSRIAIMGAAVVMAAATLGNLVYLVTAMSGGVPIASAVAVLVGGYATFSLLARARSL